MNKTVYLVTTKGCESCYIMENILRDVHGSHLYTFSIEIVDVNKVPGWIYTNIVLTDFPTLIFIENNIIKYTHKGTISKSKLTELIKELKFNE